MAIGFDSSERITRTTSLPSPTSFTACGWAYNDSGIRNGSYQMLFTLVRNSGDIQLISINPSNQIFIYNNTIGSDLLFSTHPSTNTWFFFACKSQGTGSSDYIGYWADITSSGLNTVAGAGRSFAQLNFNYAGHPLSNEAFGGNMSSFKIWNTPLTEAEIRSEMWSIFPRRVSNLIFFNPGFDVGDVIRDWTGTANLSTVGTPTTEAAGPPIGWGVKGGKTFMPGLGTGPSGYGRLLSTARNRLVIPGG